MIRRFLRRLIRDEDAEAFARDTALLMAFRRNRRRPSEVGRQATLSAQIRDTVNWLQVNGWQWEPGQLRGYALLLLELRDRYERVKVS